jgi:hypothetical protein
MWMVATISSIRTAEPHIAYGNDRMHRTNQLCGCSAIVTSSTSGFGLAIACALAGSGVNVRGFKSDTRIMIPLRGL